MLHFKPSELAYPRSRTCKETNDKVPEPVLVVPKSLSQQLVFFIAYYVVQEWLLLNSNPFESHAIEIKEIKIDVDGPDAIVRSLG